MRAKPELEVFDMGHIEKAKHLIRTGRIKSPPLREPKAIAPVTEARLHPNSSTIGFMNIDKIF